MSKEKSIRTVKTTVTHLLLAGIGLDLSLLVDDLRIVQEPGGIF